MFEIEHTMSVNELHDWSEYLSLEPSNSIEIQIALLTTVVANMMGGKRTLDDFLITNYKVKVNKSNFASEDAVKSIFSFISK